MPEQTMLVLGRDKDVVDIQLISPHSNSDHSLLTQQDAEKMAKVFGDLHSTMLKKPHKLDDTVALDIEFMVVDNNHTKVDRELIVLQARPYQVNVPDIDALEKKLIDWINRWTVYIPGLNKKLAFKSTIELGPV